MINWLGDISKAGTTLIAMIGLLLGVIALVYAIVVQVYAGKLKRRYLSLVRGESGTDLESLIQKINTTLEDIKQKISEQDNQIENHETRLKKKALQPIVKRYNAFGENGNDLSFSVAILNEEGSGVVRSSIYGREDSIVFAKPIIEKQSGYKLTNEENEVINSAK